MVSVIVVDNSNGTVLTIKNFVEKEKAEKYFVKKCELNGALKSLAEDSLIYGFLEINSSIITVNLVYSYSQFSLFLI
jgi:hypothetical protein